LEEKLLLRQTPGHPHFRTILQCSRSQQFGTVQKELVIKNEEGEYTNEFVELLKDYYLYLDKSIT
ncbi:MAG TPA: hypothetical protein VH815_06900, partial [Acidobacteriota bacterium]